MCMYSTSVVFLRLFFYGTLNYVHTDCFLKLFASDIFPALKGLLPHDGGSPAMQSSLPSLAFSLRLVSFFNILVFLKRHFDAE